MKQNSDILIYWTKDNETRIETRLKDETESQNNHWKSKVKLPSYLNDMA